MNGDIASPHVHHDKNNNGILDTYISCTPIVDMFGPTYFHLFLKEINDLCEEKVKYEKTDDPSTHGY